MAEKRLLVRDIADAQNQIAVLTTLRIRPHAPQAPPLAPPALPEHTSTRQVRAVLAATRRRHVTLLAHRRRLGLHTVSSRIVLRLYWCV